MTRMSLAFVLNIYSFQSISLTGRIKYTFPSLESHGRHTSFCKISKDAQPPHSYIDTERKSKLSC